MIFRGLLIIFLLSITLAISPPSPQKPIIAVLCYHHLDLSKPINSPYSVDSEQFVAQLKALQSNGFKFITLKQLGDFYYNNSTLPTLSALITFDDGYLNNYTRVYPLLKKMQIPWVEFVYVTGLSYGHQGYFLDWKDLKKMVENGVEIGCHSFNHPLLTIPPQYIKSKTEYDEWLTNQLLDSRRVIEQHLGVSVNALALPYGAWDRYIYDFAIKNNYLLCFNVSAMNNTQGTDKHNLNRFIVLKKHSPQDVVNLALKRPIFFDKQNPDDLARIVTNNLDISFVVENIEDFKPATLKFEVTSLKNSSFFYDKQMNQYKEKLQVTKEQYYLAKVSAVDNLGWECQGTWLFQYNRKWPRFLQP